MIQDLGFLVEKWWLSSFNIEFNKIDMPDIMNCDIWIRTCMLEKTDKVYLQWIQIFDPAINYDQLRNEND